jgi:hypothetical protein
MTAALTQGLIETITLSVANVAGKYAQPHMMTLKDLVIVVVSRIENAEAGDNSSKGRLFSAEDDNYSSCCSSMDFAGAAVKYFVRPADLRVAAHWE